MRPLSRISTAAVAVFAAASLLWGGVVAMTAVLGGGPVASAQAAGGQGNQRGQRFAKMLMELRPPLNDAQKAQIRKLRDDMRAQYRNEQQPADPAARRARYETFIDKIRGVLNPAQQRDFDAKRAAMRARMQQQPH